MYNPKVFSNLALPVVSTVALPVRLWEYGPVTRRERDPRR